jgi:hypothetical protein
MYKELANKYYKNHNLYKKALSAGTALDNALKLSYTKGGFTNTHFMLDNYLAYFDYEVLKNRNLI